LINGTEKCTSILAVGKSQITAKLGTFGKYIVNVLQVYKSDAGEGWKISVGLIV
jgi:hypothetical protein